MSGRSNLFLSPILPIAIAFAAGIALRPYCFLSIEEELVALLTVIAVSIPLVIIKPTRSVLALAWLGFALCGLVLATLEQAPLPLSHIRTMVRQKRVDAAKPAHLVGHESKRVQGDVTLVVARVNERLELPLPASRIGEQRVPLAWRRIVRENLNTFFTCALCDNLA